MFCIDTVVGSRLIHKLAVKLGGEEIGNKGQHGNQQQNPRTVAQVGKIGGITKAEATDVEVGNYFDFFLKRRNYSITKSIVLEVFKSIDNSTGTILQARQKLDGTTGRLQGFAKTACRRGCGCKGGNSRSNALAYAKHVVQRVHNNVIECNNNRHLHDQRQATAIGAVIFALIELLNLRLHFLHGGLIVASLVLVLNCHFLGTETCLLNGVLLLHDGKRQHQDFDYNCEQANTDDIVAKAEPLGNPIQNLTDYAKHAVQEFGFINLDFFAESGKQASHVSSIQLIQNTCALFVRKLCIGIGSNSVCCSRYGVCFSDNILCGIKVQSLVLFEVIGVAIIKAGNGHIIATVSRNQSFTSVKCFLCAVSRR